MFKHPRPGFTDPAEQTGSDTETTPISPDEAADADHFDQEVRTVRKTGKPRISQDRIDNQAGFRSWRVYWPAVGGSVRHSEHDYQHHAQDHLEVLYQAGAVNRP